MGPHRYSSRNLDADRADPGKKLHDVPQAQENYGWHRQGKNENKCKDAGSRIEKHVSAHHTRNGPAGAHRWDVGVKIEKHVQQARADPADQVKKEITDVTEKILHIVPEDPQKKHVASEMQKPGMEKHAGY